MILAIETSSTRHSLCFASLDAPFQIVAGDHWEAGARSGRLIAELDRRRDLLPRVRAVAVGVGPGSFSGIRAAIAAAKGLRLVLGCPLLGICSADAVGRALDHVTRLGVFADAKRGEYYLTVFENGRRLRGPLTVPRESVDSEISKLTLAVSAETLPGIPERATPDAITLASLARESWIQNPGHSANLEPIYLRGPTILPPRG